MTKKDLTAIAGIWAAAQSYFASAGATDLAKLCGHYATSTALAAEAKPEENDHE